MRRLVRGLRDRLVFAPGGVEILTEGPDGIRVRTLLQPDGDILATLDPRADRALVTAHLRQVERVLRRLRLRLLRMGALLALPAAALGAASGAGAEVERVAALVPQAAALPAWLVSLGVGGATLAAVWGALAALLRALVLGQVRRLLRRA